MGRRVNGKALRNDPNGDGYPIHLLCHSNVASYLFPMSTISPKNNNTFVWSKEGTLFIKSYIKLIRLNLFATSLSMITNKNSNILHQI